MKKDDSEINNEDMSYKNSKHTGDNLFDERTYDESMYEERSKERMNLLHLDYIKENQERLEGWDATTYFTFDWFKEDQYANFEDYAEKEREFGDLKALDYQSKLRYVEHVGRCYYVGFYEFRLDNTFFTIKPAGLNERILYCNWVIDKWRLWFHQGREILGENDFQEVYRDIDSLLSHYLNDTATLKKPEIPGFINGEMKLIKSFINRSSVTDKLVDEVFSKLADNLDSHIYHQSVDSGSHQKGLKDIAKIWDMLKYRAFLENEHSKFISRNQSNVETFFSPLLKSQIESIYQYLVAERYIADDTNIDCFIKLLSNEQVSDDFFIKWVDKAPDNHEVNKITLIELIDMLFDADENYQRAFLKRYFKTWQVYRDTKKLTDIATRNLTKSWGKWKKAKENKSLAPRHQQLINYIESVWNQ